MSKTPDVEDLGRGDTDMFDIQQVQPKRKQLGPQTQRKSAQASPRGARNLSQVSSNARSPAAATAQAQEKDAQALHPQTRKPLQASNVRSLVATTTTPVKGTAEEKEKVTTQAPPKEETYDIILQPETRPISQERLVAQVKGIYAGLVIVEAKCIEVYNKQAILAQADPSAQLKLNNEQWQALIALHRTLLYKHHDFFLASQQPSASPALRRLASKYAMPARMWYVIG
jgi:hypothetical protein